MFSAFNLNILVGSEQTIMGLNFALSKILDGSCATGHTGKFIIDSLVLLRWFKW